MPRLIDADALQRLLLPIATGLEKEYGSLGGAVSGVMLHIDNAPTVDAVPVVHGRWEPELMPTGVEYIGYEEMTVYRAIRSADADKERISKTMHAIRAVAALAGLEITNWIEFRDIRTGADYR